MRVKVSVMMQFNTVLHPKLNAVRAGHSRPWQDSTEISFSRGSVVAEMAERRGE